MSRSGKKVIVAMSSGVDSSVAAALLKKQGYDVVGVFMHFWKEPGSDILVENKCCSLESQQDARKVARILDIPFYTVNASKEFKEKVVDYFLEESREGRTPNPCVACNEHIKFTFLFRKMLELDADYVATGHYANIEKKEGMFHFYTSSDEDKDQTYFLYNLTQEELSRVMFPIGGYKKSKVRKMAKEMEIPVFDKDDSQGLCFTPEKYPTEFIKRHMKMKPGEIRDSQGNVLGRHIGLQAYTIGQRRGINIGGNGPYYVASKDFDNNVLVVTNNENDLLLYKDKMVVDGKNWTVKEPELPFECMVKARYRHPLVRVIIERKNEEKERTSYEISFKEPQKAITPGQSAVFYSKNGEVLGGGIIC